jgi:hypothetical protein
MKPGAYHYELTTSYSSVLITLDGYAGVSNAQQQVDLATDYVTSNYEIAGVYHEKEREAAAWDIYQGIFNKGIITADEEKAEAEDSDVLLVGGGCETVQ